MMDYHNAYSNILSTPMFKCSKFRLDLEICSVISAGTLSYFFSRDNVDQTGG